jgi:hypothetical protein
MCCWAVNLLTGGCTPSVKIKLIPQIISIYFSKFHEQETLTLFYFRVWKFIFLNRLVWRLLGLENVSFYNIRLLTHWHTQPAVRRADPSMPLLLILALCQ